MNLAFPNWMPFEERILDFIKQSPPDAPLYTDDISRRLGIGMKAVSAAIASLESKGLIGTVDEPQGGGP
jgi:DNA-binding MarR family transcriptional regulator